MSDPRGAVRVQARGKDYTLWLGMSGLADLQGKHGDLVLQKLEPPPGASPTWLPPLHIVVDLLLIALQRYHSGEADRWLVDEILAENIDVMPRLMTAAFPDQSPAAEGNGTGPQQAALTSGTC